MLAARRAATFSCRPGTRGSFVSVASSGAFPGRLSLDNRRRRTMERRSVSRHFECLPRGSDARCARTCPPHVGQRWNRMVGRTKVTANLHRRSYRPARRHHRVADRTSTKIAGGRCGGTNALFPCVERSVREVAMFAIIGIVIVFGCVVAGYLMEHGNLRVLIQPAELIIIGGASVGTLLVANPLHILKKIANGIGGVFGGSKFGKQTYIQALKMMYDLLNKARKDGLMALESDVEEPEKSPVFSKNPSFLKNHHVRDFVCDSLRMAITGIDAFDLDQMLDLDLEVHHQDSAAPTAALSTMADSLPGLGIVAAVLGVVITMGALGGPPEEIGHKVAAALVGTFLGILLCYGLVGPIAASMGKGSEEEHAFYHVLRVVMISFLKGLPPTVAVEVGRRAIPGHVRPSFQETEKYIKGGGGAAPVAEAPAAPAAPAAAA